MYYENRKKGIYFWIVILVIVFGLINTPAFKRTHFLHSVKTIASNVFFPFKYIGTGIYTHTANGITGFFHIKGVQKENEQLKYELAEMKAQVMMAGTLDDENKKLRNMLAFRARYFASRLIPAEIIGRSSSNWFEVIEINRGTADNVLPDMAVVNEDGLVGRVYEVAQFSSKVLLISDPTSAVSILDSDTGDMAIVSGNSIGPLSIKFMPAIANIKVGDNIVTSGMSDIFPKGIIVGKVKTVSKKDYDIFQKVEVAPAVNISRLDKLFVVAK
jgi:rod shape-determining protein MreC